MQLMAPAPEMATGLGAPLTEPRANTCQRGLVEEWERSARLLRQDVSGQHERGNYYACENGAPTIVPWKWRVEEGDQAQTAKKT